MHCRPSNLDCMETALVLNCCSRWAKQCLIWNKCYAIDSDRVGAGSRWEKPSWEPSPGLEKSTVKLLGRSTSQGKHPWLQDLPVLSLKWQKGKKEVKVPVLFFLEGGWVYLHFFALFLSLGQKLPWGIYGVLPPLLYFTVAWDAKQDLTHFLSALFLPGREGPCFLAKPFATGFAELPANSRDQLCALYLQLMVLSWQLYGWK